MKRRRDMCTSNELIPEIPFDLMIEILTKLPAISLMRFKSVSKLWSSLICSRTFTNRLQRVSSSSLRLYFTLSFIENSERKRKLYSSSSPPSSDITTMSSFVIEQEVNTPAMKGYYVHHVFHGLMCLAKMQSSQIYNTTTRQLVVLPDIEESNIIAEGHKFLTITYRIGHDSVCDQYKVVCIIARPYKSEHWVFLLGRDKSSRWRKIPCSSPHFPLTDILIINGRMHYLAWIQVFAHMLVSFDFCSEEICLIQVSEDICISITDIDPIEYYGKVALLDHLNLNSQGTMNLWVIDDAEKNMWVKKTLVVHSHMDIINNIHLKVQGTTRNNEIILVPHNFKYTTTGRVVEPQETTLVYIFLYDLQKNLMRKVEINETPYLTNIWDVVGLDDVENFMYL